MKDIYFKLSKGRITNILIIIMGAIILIYSFPIYKSNIQAGLDPSWQYAINYLPNHFKWGSEVNFTYGPIGFLGCPQDIGNNMIISYCFWMILYCLNIIGVVFLIKKNLKEGSVFTVLLSTTLFLFSTLIFYQPEYYLMYIAALFASISWHGSHRISSWIIANIIFCISFYFKLSASIIIGSILFLMIISFAFNKQEVRRIITVFTLSCFMILVSLFIYTGSFDDSIRYIKSSLDLSSGYSIAMSITAYDVLVPVAVCMIILYLILTVVLLKINKNTGLYLLTFIGSIFFVFKHGFVRADGGHIILYFFFFSMLISLQLMFIDCKIIMQDLRSSQHFNIYKKVLTVVGATFILIYILFGSVHGMKENQSVLALNQIKTKPLNIITYFEPPVSVQADNSILDLRIIEEIGHETVTIFPWEISYAAFNDLNYVPLPIFQTYSAYTPYLDQMDAEFLMSKDAPQYIIFQFLAIDGRHPLIDVPKTWEAINNNYEATMAYNGVALLKKNKDKYVFENDMLDSMNANKSQIIRIPNSEDTVVAKIDIELSLLGKVVKFFYKIPEVDLNIIGDKELSYKYRIIPENLENGLIINKIPAGLVDTLVMLDEGKPYQNVEKMKLSGSGLRFYKEDINIEYYRLKLKDKLEMDIEGDYLSGEASNVKTGQIVGAANGSIDIIGNSTLYPGFLQISGWANVPGGSSNNQKVYLEIQDEPSDIKHYYLAKQTMRLDISQYFNSPNFDNSGYDFQLDLMRLDKNEKHYGRVLLENEGKFYTVGEKQKLNNEIITTDKKYSEQVEGIKFKKSEHVKGYLDIFEIDDFDFNTKIKIQGWAFIDNENSSGQSVFIQVTDDKGDKRIYKTTIIERPDVGKYFNDSDLSDVGFSCDVDYSTFAGKSFKVNIIVTNGEQYFGLDKDFSIK